MNDLDAVKLLEQSSGFLKSKRKIFEKFHSDTTLSDAYNVNLFKKNLINSSSNWVFILDPGKNNMESIKIVFRTFSYEKKF
jgi:hypothetical protein